MPCLCDMRCSQLFSFSSYMYTIYTIIWNIEIYFLYRITEAILSDEWGYCVCALFRHRARHMTLPFLSSSRSFLNFAASLIFQLSPPPFSSHCTKYSWWHVESSPTPRVYYVPPPSHVFAVLTAYVLALQNSQLSTPKYHSFILFSCQLIIGK